LTFKAKAKEHPQDALIVANDSLITGKQRHCCNSAADDLFVTKQSKCNDLQGQEQGLGNKAKAKDLTFKAKDSHHCHEDRESGLVGSPAMQHTVWN